MTHLPPEVRNARELLRGVSLAPDAEARVYWNVMAAARERRRFGLRFSSVTVGVLLSASAALGFGVASRIERPFGAVTPLASPVAAASAPMPHPPRRSSRGVEVPLPIPQNSGGADAVEHPSPSDENAQELTTDARRATLAVNADSALSRPERDASGQFHRTQAAVMDVGAAQSRPEGERVAESPARPNRTPSGNPTAAVNSAAVPSELSQEVGDYREAVSHLPAEPARALGALEAYRRKWPSGALLHEVDLRIIQTLLALGRHAEASRAAARFLVRYPESARAAQVRRLVETGQTDDTIGDGTANSGAENAGTGVD